MEMPLRRIAEFINAEGDLGTDAELCPSGYSIDTRTIQPGELFFAVKGEKLDGHDYLKNAFERGALAAVVSREKVSSLGSSDKVLVVKDTLVALQTLAAAVRRLWNKPLVAITGSAGKTTTKEITSHLLAKKCRVLKSHGNLNNHFGLPLQLLRLKPEHDVAVFELG